MQLSLRLGRKMKKRIRYLIYPGWSYDYFNNKTKFMNAEFLIAYYGLDEDECVEVKEEDSWIRYINEDDYIQVRPPIIKTGEKKREEINWNNLRTEADLTQKELAIRAGLTLDQYKFIELGRTPASRERTLRLLKVLRDELKSKLVRSQKEHA